MARIGVIVPVFNCEGTLERCVGSILAQTHSDIDVILVDDGSTDISGAMCDAYAELDPRVRALHTSNRGLSAARNAGIECALENGVELIAFADADDYMEVRMLEELLVALESTDADIAQCGVRVEGFRSVSVSSPPEAVYDRREAVRAHLRGEIGVSVWNKLYRGRVFDDLRFPEGRTYEDVATTYRALMRCDRLASIAYIGYHHVMREGSITHTHTMRNLADYWAAHKERYDFFSAYATDLLDGESLSRLPLGPASAISRMWRWAYANSREERSAYAGLFREMQDFERQVLRGVDKRGWQIRVTLPLLLVRSRSAFALAAAYYANQIAIRINPKQSGIRR